MRFEKLRVDGLRSLSDLDLSPGPGINFFVGDNGAGKTSVLEAAFLLSHASSFRPGAKDALIQRDARSLSIFAELHQSGESSIRLGLGRALGRWDARVDGDPVTIGQLVRQCAVVCFEPGSHALIAGPADERRRYLDWGVFHVEHDFLGHWQRYQRALKQRNSLLRSNSVARGELFDPWEAELAASGQRIDAFRHGYLEQLRPLLADFLAGLLPELGQPVLRYRRGWSEEESLEVVLNGHRARDAGRGHTTAGPHRADWSIVFENAPLREHLSRGQEKLTAMACVLAQAQLYARICGEWPVVCLDDLSSELDQEHQAAVMLQLKRANAQVLVTGTEIPSAMRTGDALLFHVEQGKIAPLL